METSPSSAEPSTTRCPRCGASFVCGAHNGASGCWCMQLPKLPPEAGLSTCLCPACLQARLDASHDHAAR